MHRHGSQRSDTGPEGYRTHQAQRQRTTVPAPGGSSLGVDGKRSGSLIRGGSDVGRSTRRDSGGSVTSQPGNEHEIGLFLIRAVEHLKASRGPVETKVLQQLWGRQNDKSIVEPLRELQRHPRARFDKAAKTWNFVPPYAHIVDNASLLAEVHKDQYRWSGFVLTHELLESQRVQKLCKDLLPSGKVRALRVGKLPKCRQYPPELDQRCGLLDPPEAKCDNCASLAGVSLYPPRQDEGEVVGSATKPISDDLKESFLQLRMPDQQSFLAQTKLKHDVQSGPQATRKRRRNLRSHDDVKVPFRANQVINTHIWKTAEDYKKDLIAVAQEGHL